MELLKSLLERDVKNPGRKFLLDNEIRWMSYLKKRRKFYCNSSWTCGTKRFLKEAGSNSKRIKLNVNKITWISLTTKYVKSLCFHDEICNFTTFFKIFPILVQKVSVLLRCSVLMFCLLISISGTRQLKTLWHLSVHFDCLKTKVFQQTF